MMPNAQAVLTAHAPKPLGPYSQAIKAGNLLFVSGQIAIDPADGGICGDNIQVQTRQAMANVEAVLDAAGCSMRDVVKITVFISDMGLFSAFNEVYASYFVATPPARSCVQVVSLPQGALVEIEAVALDSRPQ
jgi:2-iminobutanoate/2-iminopropanoate deaminase